MLRLSPSADRPMRTAGVGRFLATVVPSARWQNHDSREPSGWAGLAPVVARARASGRRLFTGRPGAAPRLLPRHVTRRG